MFFTALIYMSAVISVLSYSAILISLFITVVFVYLVIKDILPVKYSLVWMLVFYIGIANTSLRLKSTDNLLNLAPRNAVIYGKIISIPQSKNDTKQTFFFKVNKIEYDSISKEFDNEKTLVTLNSQQKFKIYDSYKIRGRLSTPIKAGNPFQFDYGNYLRNFSAYAVFYGKNPYNWTGGDDCFEKIESSDGTLKERFIKGVNNYRENVIKRHSKYIKTPNLEILGGIVFGDDAVSTPQDIKQSFINSGLLHILAASGMNVAFIFSFFFFILNIFRINYKINICICMMAVIVYVLMTGMGASVLRAGLMLLFVLIGKLIDRDAHSISLLSLVAMILLIYNPMLINDVGFQLSFIVTFGLLVMTPYLLQTRNRFINWIIGVVSIPVIAQLWVIPIQLYYFSNISLYSVFANIMSVPILSVVSFGGFISSLLAGIPYVSLYLCKGIDIVLNPLITLIVNISDFWGSLPYSSIQTSHPSVIQIIVYYSILLCMISFLNKDIKEKYKRFMKYVLTVLIVILLLSFITVKNNNLEITAFDVGNADSFLIKTPENKFIMIDTGKAGYNGGKSQAEMIMLKYFFDKGIKNIDTIIVTHFDNDHCGGAADLINKLNVDRIYVNELNHPSASAKDIFDAAKKRHTKIIEANNEQYVINTKDLKIKNFIVKDIPGIGDNESSIISLLTYKNFSILFMGDAGIETFNRINKSLPGNITVLKVGHHGASGVVNKKMTEYLNPKYALISTGENKFGHPSPYTLKILNKSKIYRTDINNAIKFVVNQDKVKVITYNPKSGKFED